MKKIWFAGGCFWGVEAYFQQVNGVSDTEVGYGQGHVEQPTYETVCSGETGHAEITEICYDPTVISLEQLLEHLFRIINPTSLNKQGNDRGTQYRTGVYYQGDEETTVQQFLQAKQAAYDKPIVVECERLKNFYPAEAYHQNYLANNPNGYCHVNLNLVKDTERKK